MASNLVAVVALLLGFAVFGFPLAAWGYPRSHPALRPYVWIVLILLGPLAGLLLLQALFTLPPGTCFSDRPMAALPWLLAGASVVAAITLFALYPGQRRFVAGVAIAFCPTTLLWTPITIMSLVGCWI